MTPERSWTAGAAAPATSNDQAGRLWIVNVLDAWHPNHRVVLAVATLTVVGVAAVDFTAGEIISLRYLFLVPVVAITWLVDRRSGLVLTGVAALSEIVIAALASELDWATLLDVAVRASVLVLVLELVAELKILVRSRTREAATDPLTGLWNRRAFLVLAEREIRRGERYGRPVTVLFLDLNDFKRVNDERGHDEGDRTLVAVASKLRSLSRSEDVVGRLGGDEFGIVLAESADGEARAMTERLESLRVGDLRIGVSVGRAVCPPAPYDLSTALRLADDDLYRNKHRDTDPRGRPGTAGARRRASDDQP